MAADQSTLVAVVTKSIEFRQTAITAHSDFARVRIREARYATMSLMGINAQWK